MLLQAQRFLEVIEIGGDELVGEGVEEVEVDPSAHVSAPKPTASTDTKGDTAGTTLTLSLARP